MKIAIVLIGLAVLGVVAFFMLKPSAAATNGTAVKPPLNPLTFSGAGAQNYPEPINWVDPRTPYEKTMSNVRTSSGAPALLARGNRIIQDYLDSKATK